MSAVLVLAGALIAALLFAGALTASLKLSRAFAWQMVMISVLGFYVLAVVAVNAAIGEVAGAAGPLLQIGFLAGATTAALVTLLARRERAALRVRLAKHLFRHRYDYRAEWARFSETVAGADGASVGERAARAIAQVLGAPGALLLAARGDGTLEAEAGWNWNGPKPARAGDARWVTEGRVIELDAARGGNERDAAAAPEWLLAEADAWAIVPLLHGTVAQGAVVVMRPPLARALDWEDFDLLKAVGRQAASVLAEARSQERLAEARRFEEFNRRFAFVMHDIKNLASQLGLVAKNAERHAGNPAFQADMIATLGQSVDKMNALLARLSQHHRGGAEPARPVAALAAIEAAAREAGGRAVTMATGDPVALADPARLEQALAHLIRNACEASPANEPVTVKALGEAGEVRIEVRDRGAGMSAEFVRTRLFQPFASTKPAGFGIGAHEALTLIEAMGGRIEVESREGEGSVFTVVLPAAGTERMAA